MKTTSIAQAVLAFVLSTSLASAGVTNCGSNVVCMGKCCEVGQQCGGWGFAPQCCLPTNSLGCSSDFDCCERGAKCSNGKCTKPCVNGQPQCTGKCCEAGWQCGGWGFAPQCCLPTNSLGCKADIDCCERGSKCSNGKCTKPCADGRPECTGKCCGAGWQCGGWGFAPSCCLPRGSSGCNVDFDCCERGSKCKNSKCYKPL